MQKTCPFCRTEIDYYAAVCPNCTRHQSKDRESVFGEPPTLSSNSGPCTLKPKPRVGLAF